jgi:hypothetical protein
MKPLIRVLAFICGLLGLGSARWMSTRASAQEQVSPQRLTREQVDSSMKELSNWGRGGKDDQRGTLNLITPGKRLQSIRLGQDGVSVSLAHTLEKEQFPDNPRPLGSK